MMVDGFRKNTAVPSARGRVLGSYADRERTLERLRSQTFDLLVKAKAWPQNEGLLKANIEGTIKSETDFKKITKPLTFEDVTDLTIVKRVVDQLGRVKDFPY